MLDTMQVWILLLLLSGSALGKYFGNPTCREGRDVFVHLFEWKWSDVAAECPTLAQAGYCAVQLSPVNEHRVINGYDGQPIYYPWWQRYQPVSYKLDSRSGTREDFIHMVQTCNDVGVYIYADAIINHMAQWSSGVGSGGSEWDGDNYNFPAVPFERKDFHGPDVCFTEDGWIWDYQNPDEVRYCQLNGLRDLRHSNFYVQEKISEYLNDLINIGVAGFRIDASKHMFPSQIEPIYEKLVNLNTRWFPEETLPFIFQEVIDLGGEPIESGDYTHIGRVTEFKYGMNLGDVIRGNFGQKLAYLKNFGEGWGFMSGLSAVVFVDNHDNQRGHGAGGFSRILTFFEADMYKKANAFQLAWPYGYVRVMSSYDWPRDIQDGVDVNDWMGPPYTGDGVTNNVTCFEDWICEHRWHQISKMVGFHNAVAWTDVENWYDNGNNMIAFSRGDKGFLLMNNEAMGWSQDFYTGLPDGEYCDVISCASPIPPCMSASRGQCRPSVSVTSGWARIQVPDGSQPDAILAIHVP